MKKAKKVGRKALSLVLSFALILTTFVFFDIGNAFKASAATSADGSISVTDNDVNGGVYFYVPEEVYLQPSLTSHTTQDRYNFQWFVDSAIDTTTHAATPRTGENSSGNLYFYYEYASQVSISYKYLSQNLSDMTAYTVSSMSTSTSDYANANCFIKLAANSNYLRASNTSTNSSNIRYTVGGNTINTTITTESISPYLLASTTGYYIEWTASFVDSRDGLTKTAYAYTYVYKPYIQPIGVGLRTKNNRGNDSYGSINAWLSGLHGLNGTAGSYYPKAETNGFGLVPFSSSNPVGVQLGVLGEKLYAQYATAIVNNGYFKYTASKNNPDGWFSTSSNTYFTTDKTFNYVNNDTDGSSSGDNAFYTYGYSPKGKLMVDSSRYTNFSQIPNLSVGLFATDDEGCDDNGAWYVADATGKSQKTEAHSYQKNSNSTALSYWNDYTALMFNVGTPSSRDGTADDEGVKYNGRWVKSITSSSATGDYNVQAAYMNYDDGDECYDIAYMPVRVTINNKGTLRTAFNNATAHMSDFSMLYDGTSPYYDTTSSYWTNFINLYKAAGRLLANLDTISTITVDGTSYTCTSLATALNSAVTNVENCRKSSTASTRFLGISKNANGEYVLTNIYDEAAGSYAPDSTLGYKYGNTVTMSARTFAGYTYVGYSTNLANMAGKKIGASYSALISSTNSSYVKNYIQESNVGCTFYYVPTEFSTLVDTAGGKFNYMKVDTSGYPEELTGIGYPSHAALASSNTDINYTVDGNTVTAWSTAASTDEQYQFLPYYIDLEPSTSYIVTYDVTGTDPVNIELTAYNNSFTGGNSGNPKYYDLGASGSQFTVSANDSGRAYIRLELAGGARNGKTVIVSDICITKADTNELYLNATSAYPVNFIATTADKTGMSYTANGTASLAVTSQYNSLTYQQKQFLPYYLDMKPGTTYKFTYDVAGVNASQVHFVLYNSSFTGGNGTTGNYYQFSGSGSTITAGAADNGTAQLRVELTDVGANTRATITNLMIKNTDSRTTITGAFNDTYDLGIPVRPGYKFTGWTAASNAGGSAYGLIGKGVDNISASNCLSKADLMWITNGSEKYLNVELEDEVVSGTDFFDYIDFDVWGAEAGFTPGQNYTLSAKVRINSITTTGNTNADSERAVVLRNAARTNEWISQTEYKSATDGWVNFSLTRSFTAEDSPRLELAFYIGETLLTEGGADMFNVNLDLKDIKIANASGNVVYSFEDQIGQTSSGQLYMYRYGSGIDLITANWETDTCKVIFRDLDGNVVSEQNVLYGRAASTPSAQPAVFGKTFSGWDTDYSNVTRDLIIEPTYDDIDITVTPSKTTLSMYVGDIKTLTASFSPNEPEISAITWSSTNTSVATVNSNGKVTAAGEGTAVVTATVTYAGRTYSGSCNVTVNAVELTGVAINTTPTKTQYFTGEQLDTTGLTLKASYNNGTTAIISSGYTLSTFSSATPGQKTIRVTYGGYTTTFKVTVIEIVVVSLEITKNPNKTTYYVGDTSLDKTGLTAVATYNNGDTENLSSGSLTVSGFNTSTAGTVTLTAEYEGCTDTFTITVIPVQLVSIAVNTMPNKTTYYVGDTFDQTGLKLTGTNNNGSTQIITSGFTVSGFSSASAGTKTLTVNYNGLTTTFNVTVNAIELTGISVKTNPTKTTYYVGDTADYTGLTLLGTYNNGSTTTISDGFTCSGFTTASAGTKTITVSYMGFTTTFNINVIAVTLTSVSINTSPTKTSYYVGDTLDTTGLTLKAVYNNGKTEIVSSGYTIGTYNFSTAGTKTISVTYSGKSTTFSVIVNNIAPVSIAVKTMPTKTTYFVGESLNSTGLVIKVTNNNGSTQDISSGFSLTGFSSAAPGTSTVTVTYSGLTTTFNVTIRAIELTGISISTKPTKLSYYTGDELNTSGLVLTLTYNNGTTSTVTSGYLTSGYDMSVAGNQTVTVTYQGFTDTYTISVAYGAADYSAVDAAIARANALTASNYVDFSAVTNAVNAVVRGKLVNEQATVDGYATAINNAIDDLVLKTADYSAVEAAKTAAATEKAKGIYTDASVAALDAAIDAVVYDLTILQQTTVNAYAADINDAIAALVEKPSDFSAIDALYNEIANLDSSLYSNYDEIFYGYIYTFYMSDVATAKTTLTKISQQPQVDQLLATLQSYYDMLEPASQEHEVFEVKEGSTTVIKDGYIYGLKQKLTKSSFESTFVNMENVTVTYTGSKSSRYLGTGTVVTVTSTLTGEVLYTYTIVIYGDVDGDGTSNANDRIALSNVISGSSDPLEGAYKKAANLNGDRRINAQDLVKLNNVIAGLAEIDQETGLVD